MPYPPFIPLDRDKIIAAYPWSVQRDQNMVVGTDFDSTLSSVLAHHVMGWRTVGFYDLTNIYAAAPLEDLYKAVWVDLDISHPRIRSIGHHVLQVDNQPMAVHAQSLNLNILQNVNLDNYRRKYPLATFHFLAWLWNVDLPVHDLLALPLYWHPDSSWINGQSHRFEDNVKRWATDCIPLPALLATLQSIQTIEFERAMHPLFQSLGACGWEQGWVNPKTASRHLSLGGWQCQFGAPPAGGPPVLPKPSPLNALYKKIGEVTGWSVMDCPDKFQVLQGQRYRGKISDLVRPRNNEILDDFLDRNQVFSYAFPFGDDINYTSFGALWQP